MPNLLRAATALLVLSCACPALALDASSADDICAPDVDPCVISEPVSMDQRTTLDFGLREVVMNGEAVLDFGTHGGVVLCGGFESEAGTRIDASGSVDGELDGGSVAIQARRGCGLEPDRACLENRDCSLGTCTKRLCSGSTTRACASDSNCQLGTCAPFGGTNRCSGSFSVLCSTNADCDFGTCPADLFCSNVQGGGYGCDTNADCSLGSCSDGAGSIRLDGELDGRGYYGSQVDLLAADDVEVGGVLNLTSRPKQGAGGELTIRATFGDVALRNRLRSNGGSSGGYHIINAGGDVLLAGRIDMDGGDFDGGILDVEAGGNVSVQASIRASSRRGSGFGGEVIIGAYGNVELRPGPDTRGMRIRTNGHGGQFQEAGQGGYQDYYSRYGSLSVHEDVRFDATGGAPEGGGGSVIFDADTHLQFDGQVVARGGGVDGNGGDASFLSGGSVELGPSSVVDLDSADGAGRFEVVADGDAVLAGVVHATSPPGAGDSELQIRARDVAISGSLAVAGGSGTEIDVRACRIDLVSGASLRNSCIGGTNQLRAGESMRLHAGSELLADKGINRLVYRTDDKPPVVDGFVDTPGVLVLNEFLAGCPVCGNGEIDQGETCDDGNVADGDGCSATCLVE